MLCDVVCTGGLQNHIKTNGPRTANSARRTNPEEVTFRNSAIATSAIIHAAETAIFMYVCPIMEVYLHPPAATVLN